MGWSGYRLQISVTVDAHGGDKEKRGEELYEEFKKELVKLCEAERFNNDAISIMF